MYTCIIQEIVKPLPEYTHARKWKIKHIKVINIQMSLSQYHIAEVHTEHKYVFINYIDRVKLNNTCSIYIYIRNTHMLLVIIHRLCNIITCNLIYINPDHIYTFVHV